MILADFIKSRRAQLSLSLEVAAELADISKQGLHQMETGETWNIQVKTIVGLARAFKVQPEVILAAAMESVRKAR